MEKADKKLYSAPLAAMGIFAGAVFLYKYLSSKQILKNPLAQPTQQTKIGELVKSKGKLVFWHTLTFVGIATFFGAFFARQIHAF